MNNTGGLGASVWGCSFRVWIPLGVLIILFGKWGLPWERYRFSLRRGSSWRRNIVITLITRDTKHTMSMCMSCLRWWKSRSHPLLLWTPSTVCWPQPTSSYRNFQRRCLKINPNSCFRLPTFPLQSLIPYSNTNHLSFDEGIKINRKEACKGFSTTFSSHQGCCQFPGRVCGPTSGLSPTFLISPLLAVWKPVPSDHFTPLQRHSKFSRESERRMCLLPLQPQSAIIQLQTRVSHRTCGGRVWERRFPHFIKERL